MKSLSEDVQKLIEDYFTRGSEELEKEMLNTVKEKFGDDDIRAIKELFRYLSTL